jgi:hypothetical protein
MTEVKLTGKPLAQRIADRLQNSGAGAKPDLTTKQGDGPTRVHHNLHHSGSAGGTKLNPGEDKGGR